MLGNEELDKNYSESRRIALCVQYDGTDFSGWQKQTNASSIQEVLEQAISQLEQGPIKTFAAGRTDSGVHAAGQVAHFDCSGPIISKSVNVLGFP